MKVTVIESKRRSLSLTVTPEGEVVVRAPYKTKDSLIEEFVKSKESWIVKQIKKVQQAELEAKRAGVLSPKEVKELHENAKKFIPTRVEYYAKLMGVSPQKITIRMQKTRWGSCTRSGNLNFNCLLMLTPLEVLDSVVVHELAHMKQMNHSPKFYEEIEKVYPQYKRCHAWLKEHGQSLFNRVQG